MARWKGKHDPPGPEYLLMTSVCQPSDGRNSGQGWGWGEGDDAEGSEVNPPLTLQNVKWCRLRLHSATRRQKESDHLEVQTSFPLVMKCTPPAKKFSPWVLTQLDTRNKWDGYYTITLTFLFVFIMEAISHRHLCHFQLCVSCSLPPVRDCAVLLKLTLHIPPFPGDPDPNWNIIHPSAQRINNLLCTQAFFNKPSCGTNLLSICPVWKGPEIKFPFGEFSASNSRRN